MVIAVTVVIAIIVISATVVGSSHISSKRRRRSVSDTPRQGSSSQAGGLSSAFSGPKAGAGATWPVAGAAVASSAESTSPSTPPAASAGDSAGAVKAGSPVSDGLQVKDAPLAANETEAAAKRPGEDSMLGMFMPLGEHDSDISELSQGLDDVDIAGLLDFAREVAEELRT